MHDTKSELEHLGDFFFLLCVQRLRRCDDGACRNFDLAFKGIFHDNLPITHGELFHDTNTTMNTICFFHCKVNGLFTSLP